MKGALTLRVKAPFIFSDCYLLELPVRTLWVAASSHSS